jgi:hypothetical protein
MARRGKTVTLRKQVGNVRPDLAYLPANPELSSGLVPGHSRVKPFPDGLSSVWDASYDPPLYGCMMGFPADGLADPDVTGAWLRRSPPLLRKTGHGRR